MAAVSSPGVLNVDQHRTSEGTLEEAKKLTHSSRMTSLHHNVGAAWSAAAQTRKRR